MSSPPNKLCVLTEPYLSETQVKSLEHAIEETDIEIPVVIINKPTDPDYDPDKEAEAVNQGLGLNTISLFFKVLQREGAWTFVIAEKKVAELFGSEAASSYRTPVEDVSCLSESEFYTVEPQTDGNWSELPRETVDTIQESCDIVLRYGFGLIKGDVLTATEFGVLSFHPADIRRYRGMGPPQAFLDDQKTMGVTLQRLNEEIDAGEIIAYRETDVRDCATLWETYERLNEIQTELLAQGILNLRDPTSETTVPESLGPYYSTEKRRSTKFASQILLKNMLGRIQSSIPGA